MATFREWLLAREGVWDDEDEAPEPRSLRPGEMDEKGAAFEPDRQPDLDEFMVNKAAEFGGPTNTINGGTGYILTDGRCVPLGGSQRAQDHRYLVPSSQAMRRWGWPEEVAKQADQGSNTPGMRELMRRTGAIRVMADRRELFLDMPGRPTYSQRRVISEALRGVTNVILSMGNTRTREFEPFEFEEFLDSL